MAREWFGIEGLRTHRISLVWYAPRLPTNTKGIDIEITVEEIIGVSSLTFMGKIESGKEPGSWSQ